MTNSKITEREIYTAMIEGTIDAETLREFAEKKLIQLDKRNASAKARAEKKRAEGDAVMEAVFDLIDSEAKTRGEITEMFNATAEESLSEAKIGAKLNALYNAGRIDKTNVKVANPDGKASTKVGYFIAE